VEVAYAPAQETRSPPARTARSILIRLCVHAACLLVAVAAFGAYEHFKLLGEPSPSRVSLLVSAVAGLFPVRALARELLALEGWLLHAVHGVGGLGLLGLAAGGVISGGPILSHAALAPFAIMGAAQAVMHQDHPRSREQADALRRFATSVPEVRQFAKGDLSSPENMRRAVVVLTDLIGKAKALGETELRSDPAFQSAMARLGLSLCLDTADRAIGKLSSDPAAASAVPELRKRLAAARKTLERK
jgi:hypothetical protein